MDAADIEKLKRPQLQQLCKKFGLRAAGKNLALIESLKFHLTQSTATQATSPKQSSRKSSVCSNVTSPEPAVSPAKKEPTAKRGGRRGRPARKSPITSPVQAASAKPVENPTPVVPKVGKRGRGRKAKISTSKRVIEEKMAFKVDVPAELSVQPTKRRRSEAESTPLPSAKRSRKALSSSPSSALTAVASRASLSSSRKLAVVVTRYSDTSTASRLSPSASHEGDLRQAAVSASASPACTGQANHRSSSSPTELSSQSSTPAARQTPLVRLSRKSMSTSPVKSDTSSSKPLQTTPPMVAKTSAGRKTSASKTNSGRKVSAAVRKGRASKSPKNVLSKTPSPTGGGGWLKEDLSPSPTTGRSSRRETFTVPPPVTHATVLSGSKTSPSRRRSGRVSDVAAKSSPKMSPGSRRSSKGSVVGAMLSLPTSPASPGVSVDDMKAAIWANLDECVSTKLPAIGTTKIPRLGSSTSTGGGQSKATASGKNWSQIHNKGFSRMKSIEDDVRSRKARMEKLAASQTPKVAVASRTPKIALPRKQRSEGTANTKPVAVSSKPAPKPIARTISKPKVFQPPTDTKKLSFNFGGKPPSVTKPLLSRTTSMKTTGPSSSLIAATAASTSRALAIATGKTPVKAAAVDKRKSGITPGPGFSFGSPGFKSPAASKPKFDLKSSLLRPLSYKPHLGAIKKTVGNPPASGPGAQLKPRTKASLLKSPRVKVFRQAGSPPQDLKKPPVRNFRAENRSKDAERRKAGRSAAAMAHRGL